MKGFVLRVIFFILNCFIIVFCYPTTSSTISEKDKNVSDEEYTIIGDDNAGHNRSTSTGATATLAFLRKFGYLESLESGSSETLYSKETISDAVRLMQRFGGLPETGDIDADTLSLVTKPRCGVPDVAAVHSRSKRFAFGSKGWNKRRLTYNIENWSPQLTEESVRQDIEKAFDVWARYAHLRFVNWTSDSNRRADISISFGRGYHGDTYPFDGPGGTLAHAFYPQNNDGIGGDVHFDEDEKWFSNSDGESKNGISFLAVATHELGHSLGLAHSHVPGSVMFPYYQSRDSLAEPQLDYDDIMALYELYILRSISDGDEYTPEMTSSNPKPESTTQLYRPESTASPSPATSTPKTAVKPTTTASGPHDGTTTQSSSTTMKHTHEDLVPDLCKDGFDTVSFIRNEIFVFKGKYMWRFRSQGQEALGGYPVLTSRLFPILKNLAKIDAAFERESDGKIVFISGPSYWTFDGTSEGNSGPHKLTDFGLPNDLKNVDTALVWGKNKMTYFFKDDSYWKYNETSQQMGTGYPRNIEMWRGVPGHLTSALRYKDGRTYFFKDDEFWRFDDTVVHTDEGFPLQTSGIWFNC